MSVPDSVGLISPGVESQAQPRAAGLGDFTPHRTRPGELEPKKKIVSTTPLALVRRADSHRAPVAKLQFPVFRLPCKYA